MNDLTSVTTPRRAEVRLAVPPRPEEVTRLQQALEAYCQTPLQLQIEIDPTIMGGGWVRVGDILLDGSLRTRMETLRQHLRQQYRAMILSAAAFAELENHNP